MASKPEESSGSSIQRYTSGIVYYWKNPARIWHRLCDCLWLSHARRVGLPKGTTHHDFYFHRFIVCWIFGSFRNYCSYCYHQYGLGRASSIFTASLSVTYTDVLRIVSLEQHTLWRGGLTLQFLSRKPALSHKQK